MQRQADSRHRDSFRPMLIS